MQDLKMQDLKLRDLKMTDRIAQHENAGPRKWRTWKRGSWNCRTSCSVSPL